MRDSERYSTVVRWTKYLMDVGWLGTIEKQQKATIIILPAAIQLNQQSVSLTFWQEVIMDAYALTWDELMGSRINLVPQTYSQ
jgi:hypothetical protein